MNLPAEATGSLTIQVDGRRSVEGGLTLGQRNVMQWVTDTPGSINSVLTGSFDVDRTASLADVLETLQVLVSRHEALRTTYQAGTFPLQRVAGRVEVPVVLLTDQDPDDRAEVTRRLIDMVVARTPEVPTDGSALRLGIASTGGQRDAPHVVSAVFAITHLALDLRGKEILLAEFRAMLTNPRLRVVGDQRHQPYDQATAERAPAAVRKAEGSLRYWAKLLPELPPVPYAVSSSPSAGSAGAREGAGVRMHSVAAGCALTHIVARAKTSRAGAVMAAVCALMARRMDWTDQVFITISANRFEARLEDYVGSLAQGCITQVDTAGVGFDTLAKRCWAATVQAAAHGGYDATALALITRDIATDRGVHLVLDPLFNCGVVESRPTSTPTPVDLGWIAGATAETTFTTTPMPGSAMPLRFELYNVNGAVVLEAWSGDTTVVPSSELHDLLRAVERLLVAAAPADLDQVAIGLAMAIPAIGRGPGWRRLDGCWIELEQVRRVAGQALASGAPVRVFEQVGTVTQSAGPEAGALVAYLVATPGVRTPRQAHTRVMAALPGNPTAMAPRYYVLCATPPAEPDCLAGWQAQPVVMEGTGRPGARGATSRPAVRP